MNHYPKSDGRLPQLSERLLLIADMVSHGNRTADIGCDHGYLSIFLAKSGICKSCIAADINEKPLVSARENILLYGCADKVSTRLSDGLKEFSAGEADTVIISGMGGKLMCRILSDGAHALTGVKELILEPQSDAGALRRFLCANNYNITDEAFTRESGKYYPIIKAVPAIPGGSPAQLSDVEYEYGPFLLADKNILLYEHLLSQKNVLSAVFDSLSQGASSACRLERRLEVIEEALRYYG